MGLAHPEVPILMVLEDDACFDPVLFPEAWEGSIRTMCQNSETWDLLVLGYFDAKGPVHKVHAMQGGATLHTYDSFFGTHAYLVTQKGAQAGVECICA